jgi:DNA-binding transcriptional LysR family regulator
VSLQAREQPADDLNVETLFDDPLVIAAGAQSKWAAGRRTIDLAELVNEHWIMQPPQSRNYRHLAEAFYARGLAMPKAGLETLSMPIITHFLSTGQFIAAMPRSIVYFNSLKILPVEFPVRPWPVIIVTLADRTLSPVVERFIDCARQVAKSISGRLRAQSARWRKPDVS